LEEGDDRRGPPISERKTGKKRGEGEWAAVSAERKQGKGKGGNGLAEQGAAGDPCREGKGRKEGKRGKEIRKGVFLCQKKR
jgi:hypothetical protein